MKAATSKQKEVQAQQKAVDKERTLFEKAKEKVTTAVMLHDVGCKGC